MSPLPSNPQAEEAIFLGQSVMAKAMRAKDWAATPFGAVEQWPSSLKVAVGILLGSRQPMFMWWGPNFLCFHNDAFLAILGDRQDNALGAPADEVWSDHPTLFLRLTTAVQRGENAQADKVRFRAVRQGEIRDAYFDFSASPLIEGERVAGVFGTCTEETVVVPGRSPEQGRGVPSASSEDGAGASEGHSSALGDPFERWAGHDSFLRLVKEAPVFLVYCDANCRFRFVTRAYAERLGAKPEDLIGKSIAEVIGDEAYSQFAEKVTLVLRGTCVQFETEVALPTIGRRRVQSSYVPDRDRSGAVRGFLAILSDVTAHQQTADTFKNLNTELEQRVLERTLSLREAVVQLEEFSYTVSHDIRAPLRAMRGYAEALVEDYGAALDGTANEYLQRMIRASHRLDKLTLDVLAYSRMAQRQIQLAPVDLDNLVKDIVQLQSSLSPLAQIHVAGPFPRVLGHEALMMQCLSNILDNAVKFVPPQRIPIVRIWSEIHGSAIQLWFEDNGIGIRPEHHERIFNIFEQVNADAAYQGTGIGLAIVRKAAEKMNGSVGLESTEHSGSRFWLKFEAI